jgi:serine/threonine protein kinase
MALEELQNGRYRRSRLLGSGGMGEVHLMEDTRVNRQVAIKVIRSESSAYTDQKRMQDAARLFQREAKAIAALEHPHILPLYDFGEEVLEEITITYMVMPFCADGSLAGWLKQRNNAARLTPQDIAHAVEQAADALQYAHDQQVIHLDVKPSNFLLRSNKKNFDRPTLLLADFGIARSFTTVSNSSRTIRGTPTSMAPEQWSGSPVPATDQYALAVMTYEMLVGRPPFVGSMEQLMYRHFAVAAPSPSSFNPQLPEAIDSVLLRALAKKPEERFPSITDFASAFSEAVRELPDTPIQASISSTDDTQTPAHAGQASDGPDLGHLATLGAENEPTKIAAPAKTRENKDINTPEHGNPSTPAAALILGNINEQAQSLPERETLEQTPISAQAKVHQPFDPTSEHNLPTVSVTSSELQRSEQQPAPRRLSLVRTVSIALGIILIIVIAGEALYYVRNHQQNGSPNSANISLTQTVTAEQKVTPTAIPSPTPTLVPPGLYIADTYNGSMTDQTTYEISFYLIQSKGSGVVTGSLTINSPHEVYTLKGTVDMQGNFAFVVQQPSGQLPLYFSGTIIHQNGLILHGNYCHTNTNICPSTPGYFSAGPGY